MYPPGYPPYVAPQMHHTQQHLIQQPMLQANCKYIQIFVVIVLKETMQYNNAFYLADVDPRYQQQQMSPNMPPLAGTPTRQDFLIYNSKYKFIF